MRLAFAATIAAFTVATASAADLDVLRPSIPDVPETTRTIDWTGVEFGMTGGVDLTRADGSKLMGNTEDFRGKHVSVFAGYQYQFNNNVVLGLEGDVTYTGNDRDFEFFDASNNYIGPGEVGTDWSGSVRARVGYAFDRLQLFTTGGWAVTRAFDKVDTLGTFHETFSGFTLGAGADYAFTDNIFGRVEYRYNRFPTKDLGRYSERLAQHVVDVGLGMKF